MRTLIGIVGTISLVGAALTQASAWDRFDDLSPPPAKLPTKSEQARFEHGMASLIAEDVTTARRLLEPLANIGVTQAQVALGSLLKQFPSKQSQTDALKWFYFAANNGDERGQVEVGRALTEGKIIEQDLAQARIWLKKAAVEHNEEAAALLVETDQKIIETAKVAIQKNEFKLAESLLVNVAKDDNIKAQQLLGRLYANNAFNSNHVSDDVDMHVDIKEAVNLLQKEKLTKEETARVVAALQRAAKPGNAEAQYQLGMLFLTGRAVDRDDKKGIYWYRLAADQGHTEAQYSLGVRYVLGQGTEQDPYEAHRWFKRAAENGSAKAQRNLALSYMHGIGTDKQLDKAQEWFKKASLSTPSHAPQVIRPSLPLNDIDDVDTSQNAPISHLQESRLVDTTEQKPTIVNNTAPTKTKRNIPEKKSKLKPVDGWDWFASLPNRGYTVQMMSGLKEESIIDFVRNYGLAKGRYLHYVENIKTKSWHVLHYGYFKTEQDAKKFAEKISHNESEFKPIIREIDSIKTHVERKMQAG